MEDESDDEANLDIRLPSQPVVHLDETELKQIALENAWSKGLQGPAVDYELRHMAVGDIPVAQVVVNSAEGLGYIVYIDEVEGTQWGLLPDYRQLTRQPLDYTLVQVLREGSNDQFQLLVTGLLDLEPPQAGPISCQPSFGCTFHGTKQTIASLVSRQTASTITLAEAVPGCLRVTLENGAPIVGSGFWDPTCVPEPQWWVYP